MNYTYTKEYRTGDNSRWGKRQQDYDRSVNKAIAQNAKEEKLSFQKLLAKLRHETEVDAAQAQRYYFTTPASRYGYSSDNQGRVFLNGKQVTLGNYWFEQLGS